MGSYTKQTICLEETYGQLINVKLFNGGVKKKTEMQHMFNKLLILQTGKG